MCNRFDSVPKKKQCLFWTGTRHSLVKRRSIWSKSWEEDSSGASFGFEDVSAAYPEVPLASFV